MIFVPRTNPVVLDKYINDIIQELCSLLDGVLLLFGLAYSSSVIHMG
jgi:hypothetical protein